jgi:hypothetical protein
MEDDMANMAHKMAQEIFVLLNDAAEEAGNV